MNEVKPAIRSTEFWMVVITNIIAVVTALNGLITPEKATVILAVLNGIYTILRSLVKQPQITTIVDNSISSPK